MLWRNISIDDIVVFKPLDEESIKSIAGIFIKDTAERLKDRYINLKVSDGALKLMAKEGYDIIYGARPLKRFIQRNVENILAKEIVKGTVHEGQSVLIDEENGNIIVKAENINGIAASWVYIESNNIKISIEIFYRDLYCTLKPFAI